MKFESRGVGVFMSFYSFSFFSADNQVRRNRTDCVIADCRRMMPTSTATVGGPEKSEGEGLCTPGPGSLPAFRFPRGLNRQPPPSPAIKSCDFTPSHLRNIQPDIPRWPIQSFDWWGHRIGFRIPRCPMELGPAVPSILSALLSVSQTPQLFTLSLTSRHCQIFSSAPRSKPQWPARHRFCRHGPGDF